jgi:Chaperone of endosialidase
MIPNYITKVVQVGAGAAILALSVATSVNAQNVGIGFSNPGSKLSVNGNLAVGTNYNVAAPTNGAIIQGTVGIGTASPNLNSVLHVYNLNQAEEIIEGGSGGNGTFPVLRLTNDSSTNHLGQIQLLDSTGAKGWIISGDAKGNGTNWFSLFDQTTKVSRIVIDPSGNIGFSSDPPRACLDVPNSINVNITAGTLAFFSYGTGGLSTQPVSAGTSVASAIFGGNVWSNGSFMSFSGQLTASDARLKNIVGRSDSAKDLETLKKIEVTDYTMKDVVAFGSKPFKKVIAQQVEQVYPTAVKTVGLKAVTFTPDIYAMSTSVKSEEPGVYTISLAKAHGLKDGDIVRLITEDQDSQRNFHLAVHVVNDKTFAVETKATFGDKVFVYGKNCMDLKSVDYDAISMLNVSAAQELARKVEALEQQNSELQEQAKRLTSVETEQRAEIASLRTTSASLKTDVAQLEASNEKLAGMAAKIDVLEKELATMQEKENGLQKAALQQ